MSRDSVTTKDNGIQKLFIIYLISNVLLLLNINGIYWDDWVLYQHDFAVLKLMFSQLTGDMNVTEYIHYFLGSIGNGVFAYRIATFFVYFFSAVFLYFILLDIKLVSQKSAFYITLIFMLLPVNSARIALIDFPYGFFLAVFFMAFWLLTKYINEKRSVFFRVTILLLFFSSFVVNSFIVFYAIVLTYLLYKVYQESQQKNIYLLIKQMMFKYFDFILILLLFAYLRAKVFIPYGVYANYHKLSLIDYSKVYSNIKVSFTTAFYEPLAQAYYISQKYLLWLVPLIVCLFFYLKKNQEKQREKILVIALLIGLGLLFFVLAVFPYVAVGKIPKLHDFESRHMLLIPLGISFFLYGVILIISQKSKILFELLFCALISIFIIKNLYDQSTYLQDWFYQVALEENYKNDKAIQENSTFIFKSNILFANNRSIRFYEHNGRLRKAFGDDKRFMVNHVNMIKSYTGYKNYMGYNFNNWQLTHPLITVEVEKNLNHPMTTKTFLSLLYYMLTNDVMFRSEAKNLVQIKTHIT